MGVACVAVLLVLPLAVLAYLSLLESLREQEDQAKAASGQSGQPQQIDTTPKAADSAKRSLSNLAEGECELPGSSRPPYLAALDIVLRGP